MKKHFSIEELTKLLIKENVIGVDIKRQYDLKYIKGSPQRRTVEYLTNLQYLGFVIKNQKKYNATSKGVKLAQTDRYSKYIFLFAESFMKLKIGNEFDTRKFYSDYDNHILFSSLRMIHDLNFSGNNCYAENIALAVCAKNEKNEYQKALFTSKKFDYRKIQKIWFKKGGEFKRVIQGVFIRWLIQTKLIKTQKSTKNNFFHLTDFGYEIFKKYSKRYTEFNRSNNYSNVNKVIYSYIESQYSKLHISSQLTDRTGFDWEENVKKSLEKIGFKVEWYKTNKYFADLTLPDKALLSLPGGSQHNPDLIIKTPLWLVDPKKDVNNEMHKVLGYEVYAKFVNGLAVIVSQKMLKPGKIKLLRSLKNVIIIDGYALETLSKNSSYFKEKHLETLVLKSNQETKYINEEYVFDNLYI